VAATIVAGSIVSIPQAACSELSSGFEPAYVSGSNFKLFLLILLFLLFNLILHYTILLNRFAMSFINFYSKESTSANHDASIKSAETPTVVQEASLSVLSIITRTLDAVANFPSKTRTL